MFRRHTIAALALTALVACAGGGGEAKRLDADFERFDGSTGNVAEYRGKPVVMNFFSSTCIPCQTEMPAFEQVHRALGDAVVFLGMNVQDTVEGGKAFAQSVGITWELGRDPSAAILQGEIGGVGLPTTAVLDRDGRIVYVHLGPLDAGELTKQLRDRKLIA
jgi:thiol-disulfide isomerase/thioredoxin